MLILAIAHDLLAQLRETFKLLSLINRFFCCSNSAVANSVSQKDFVSWVSAWNMEQSGSVCVVFDEVLVVEDFNLVSEHKKVLQEEAIDSVSCSERRIMDFDRLGRQLRLQMGI